MTLSAYADETARSSPKAHIRTLLLRIFDDANATNDAQLANRLLTAGMWLVGGIDDCKNSSQQEKVKLQNAPPEKPSSKPPCTAPGFLTGGKQLFLSLKACKQKTSLH